MPPGNINIRLQGDYNHPERGAYDPNDPASHQRYLHQKDAELQQLQAEFAQLQAQRPHKGPADRGQPNAAGTYPYDRGGHGPTQKFQHENERSVLQDLRGRAPGYFYNGPNLRARPIPPGLGTVEDWYLSGQQPPGGTGNPEHGGAIPGDPHWGELGKDEKHAVQRAQPWLFTDMGSRRQPPVGMTWDTWMQRTAGMQNGAPYIGRTDQARLGTALRAKDRASYNEAERQERLTHPERFALNGRGHRLSINQGGYAPDTQLRVGPNLPSDADWEARQRAHLPAPPTVTPMPTPGPSLNDRLHALADRVMGPAYGPHPRTVGGAIGQGLEVFGRTVDNFTGVRRGPIPADQSIVPVGRRRGGAHKAFLPWAKAAPVKFPVPKTGGPAPPASTRPPDYGTVLPVHRTLIVNVGGTDPGTDPGPDPGPGTGGRGGKGGGTTPGSGTTTPEAPDFWQPRYLPGISAPDEWETQARLAEFFARAPGPWVPPNIAAPLPNKKHHPRNRKKGAAVKGVSSALYDVWQSVKAARRDTRTGSRRTLARVNDLLASVACKDDPVVDPYRNQRGKVRTGAGSAIEGDPWNQVVAQSYDQREALHLPQPERDPTPPNVHGMYGTDRDPWPDIQAESAYQQYLIDHPFALEPGGDPQGGLDPGERAGPHYGTTTPPGGPLTDTPRGLGAGTTNASFGNYYLAPQPGATPLPRASAGAGIGTGYSGAPPSAGLGTYYLGAGTGHGGTLPTAPAGAGLGTGYAGSGGSQDPEGSASGPTSKGGGGGGIVVPPTFSIGETTPAGGGGTGGGGGGGGGGTTTTPPPEDAWYPKWDNYPYVPEELTWEERMALEYPPGSFLTREQRRQIASDSGDPRAGMAQESPYSGFWDYLDSLAPQQQQQAWNALSPSQKQALGAQYQSAHGPGTTAKKALTWPEWSALGGAVKAVPGQPGRFGGYLVRWGSKQEPDISAMKDFFTPNTQTWADQWSERPLLYHHCMDEGTKDDPIIGTVSIKGRDSTGIWAEGQIDLHHRYGKRIAQMIADGVLHFSADSAPHLIERKPVGGGVNELLRFPLVAASLTPSPAEPRLLPVQPLN